LVIRQKPVSDRLLDLAPTKEVLPFHFLVNGEPKHEANNHKTQENKEDNFGNGHRSLSNSCESKKSSDECNQKKNGRPFKHDNVV